MLLPSRGVMVLMTIAGGIFVATVDLGQQDLLTSLESTLLTRRAVVISLSLWLGWWSGRGSRLL